MQSLELWNWKTGTFPWFKITKELKEVVYESVGDWISQAKMFLEQDLEVRKKKKDTIIWTQV